MPDTTVPSPAAAECQPAGDPRFTVGLLVDVARVLEVHGYERPNGGQMVELQAHLLHLLHGADRGDDRCYGGPA
jgi:hypothetical protein